MLEEVGIMRFWEGWGVYDHTPSIISISSRRDWLGQNRFAVAPSVCCLKVTRGCAALGLIVYCHDKNLETVFALVSMRHVLSSLIVYSVSVCTSCTLSDGDLVLLATV